MAAMSRNNSAAQCPGFYVFQTTLGAPLQFQPALGSKELDDMVDAYIPGAASIREKRTTISLDFFDFNQLTGQTAKFYPVPAYSFASSTNSPASTQGSRPASSFHASPVTPSWNWPASIPPSPSSQSSRSRSRAAPSPSASQRPSDDFSHLPGMKILTKDGRDVTNSTSRGCKTKEQRDHAHLMRIMKACDSCKRKKIRCDPSHKTRNHPATSQPSPLPLPRAEKRSKTATKEARLPPSPSHTLDPSPPDLLSFPLSDSDVNLGASLLDWDEFFQSNPDPLYGLTEDFDLFAPEDYWPLVSADPQLLFDQQMITPFPPTVEASCSPHPPFRLFPTEDTQPTSLLPRSGPSSTSFAGLSSIYSADLSHAGLSPGSSSTSSLSASPPGLSPESSAGLSTPGLSVPGLSAPGLSTQGVSTVPSAGLSSQSSADILLIPSADRLSIPPTVIPSASPAGLPSASPAGLSPDSSAGLSSASSSSISSCRPTSSSISSCRPTDSSVPAAPLSTIGAMAPTISATQSPIITKSALRDGQPKTDASASTSAVGQIWLRICRAFDTVKSQLAKSLSDASSTLTVSPHAKTSLIRAV